MGKIYLGEKQIIVPQDTLVLICGSQNSGKTTFTKKYFRSRDIVNTDEIFEDLLNNYSSVFDTMKSLVSRTEDIVEERITKSAKENAITVVDAVPIMFEGRMEMINHFKGVHSNILLIVLNVSYSTLKARPKKKIDKKKKKLGITPISDEELLYNSLMIKKQIQNGQFGYRVSKAYILSERDIDGCQVIFE